LASSPVSGYEIPCQLFLAVQNNKILKFGCNMPPIVSIYNPELIILGGNMSTAVKVSDDLFAKAKIKSKIFKRSIAGQIEYWAKIGQLVEDNPDLPLPFIQDILLGREQIKDGQGTPYIYGEGE
jgi:hypothetical protein